MTHGGGAGERLINEGSIDVTGHVRYRSI
jgi:hypothetical protein